MRRLSLVIFLICVPCAVAQFRITRIEPQRCGEQLCATVWMQDALTLKIEETIRSGLPAIIEFRILLFNRQHKTLHKSMVSCKIQCDIWKEEYRVESNGHRRLFHAFDSLKSHFQTLRDLPVAALSTLPAEASCQIGIQAEVMPISASQSDKVREWLVNADDEEQFYSNASRNEGFKLSLSNLVSSLFSREKKRELQTGWFYSEFFSPHGLYEKTLQ